MRLASLRPVEYYLQEVAALAALDSAPRLMRTWRCLRRFLNIQRVVGKHPSAIAADRKVGRFLPASNLSLLFMVGRTFLAFGDAHRTFVKFMASNVSLRCGTYLWI